MRIETTHSLDERQLDALAKLEQQVVTHDGGRLKLAWSSLRTPDDDRARQVLAFDADETLIGFLGLYTWGFPILELAGMVAPAARRQGVGNALLDAALSAAAEHEPKQVLLVAPRNDAGGVEFARARGARLEHSEHAMRLDPFADAAGTTVATTPTTATVSPRPVALVKATVDDIPTISDLLTDGFGEQFSHVAAAEFDREDSQTWLVFESDSAGVGLDDTADPGMKTDRSTAIGTVRTTRTGDVGAIYGFVIATSQRGRGVGRQVLRDLTELLRADGATSIELEVETENDSALGLYESVGFRRVITEDYFEVPLNR